MSSSFWFTGSLILCLATAYLRPHLSCLGQTLGEQRGGFRRWLLLLPPKNCLLPGAEENQGKGKGLSSALLELLDISFPLPEAWLLLEPSPLSLSAHLQGLGVLSSRRALPEEKKQRCFGLSVLPDCWCCQLPCDLKELLCVFSSSFKWTRRVASVFTRIRTSD